MHLKNILNSFVVLFALSLATSAVAAPEHVSRYLEASAKFDALVAERAQHRQMPRLTELQTAAVITTLTDTETFLKRPRYTVSDLDSLIAMCGKSNQAGMSYMLFGVKENLDANASPEIMAEQILRLMGKNTLLFQDELSRLLPFTVRCFALAAPLITTVVDSVKPEEITEIRRQGLRQIRSGIFTIYVGMLQCLNSGGVNEFFQSSLVESLADAASVFAPALQLVERGQILRLVDSIRPTVPGKFHAHLDKVSQAMSDSHCPNLCRY